MIYHTKNINSRYQNALKEIAQSPLSQPIREILVKQAEENRNLSLKQTEERAKLCLKHACERLPYLHDLSKDKQIRPLLKKIDNI